MASTKRSRLFTTQRRHGCTGVFGSYRHQINGTNGTLQAASNINNPKARMSFICILLNLTGCTCIRITHK